MSWSVADTPPRSNGSDRGRDIRRGLPGASLEIVELDLGSLASVRAAAERILTGRETLDLLVNNAGVMGIRLSQRFFHSSPARSAYRQRRERSLSRHEQGDRPPLGGLRAGDRSSL